MGWWISVVVGGTVATWAVWRWVTWQAWSRGALSVPLSEKRRAELIALDRGGR